MTFVTLLPCGDVSLPGPIWTVVVAGGTGRRFGGPKQFELVGDRRVIDHSRDAARSASDGVVVVVPAEHAEREGGVAGGETRSASVRAGLAAVPDDAAVVCVHDAARPFASTSLFERVIDAVRSGADGAIPGVPVSDTIKVVDDGVVVDTPDRSRLVAVQTPQAFRASVLRAAHEGEPAATDDAALVEAIGGTIVVVDGEPENRKITRAEDLAWARRHVATTGRATT
jgi:2-C-methyl-D-erythritol 4-phosphate cytidylyltransferase